MLTREQFIDYLRNALDHLYDPDQMRASVLSDLFEITDQVDIPLALQKILSKAIESLEPQGTAPAQSRAWRLYELLVCRYLQQGNVQEVADQLGISHRHLRREQNAALEMLSDRLWNQFDLSTKNLAPMNGKDSAIEGEYPTFDEELSWLKNLVPGNETDLNEILRSVLELVQPLAAHNQVVLSTTIAPVLSHPTTHPIAVRHLLLSLINFVIVHMPGGSLNMSAEAGRQGIRVQILGKASASSLRIASHDESTDLAVVQKLAALSRVELTVLTDADALMATLTFPVREQFPILVIDDNTDTLALLQRYAKGTQYRLVEETDPNNAVRVAEQALPLIIVLDVMMPKIDGWEVLARLREHPPTSDIPIIVCSILAIESLALSLGARACIRKPITQSAFLAVLDQQVEELARVPR